MEFLPNASETEVGRVQIATAADLSSKKSRGSSGARLVVPCELFTTSNYWDRSGSGLQPHFIGDSISLLSGNLQTTGLDVWGVANIGGQGQFSVAGVLKTDWDGANHLLSFYNVTPIARPTVSGSCGGIAALQSLVARLSDIGLIINNTTA